MCFKSYIEIVNWRSKNNFGMKNQLWQPESDESRCLFSQGNYMEFYIYFSIQESSKNKIKWEIGAYE